MRKELNRTNKIIYMNLALLLIVVAVLALFNRGDPELRRALEENCEFQIRVEGENVATVNLQILLALDPIEFTTTFSTSVSAPRETTFKGVELRLLLETLEIDTSNADRIIVSGLDAYYSPLTKEEVGRAETVYVCYSMDGEILKTQGEGGFGPFMLVIRGERFAQRWCKYVEAIDIRKG